MDVFEDFWRRSFVFVCVFDVLIIVWVIFLFRFWLRVFEIVVISFWYEELLWISLLVWLRNMIFFEFVRLEK